MKYLFCKTLYYIITSVIFFSPHDRRKCENRKKFLYHKFNSSKTSRILCSFYMTLYQSILHRGNIKFITVYAYQRTNDVMSYVGLCYKKSVTVLPFILQGWLDITPNPIQTIWIATVTTIVVLWLQIFWGWGGGK